VSPPTRAARRRAARRRADPRASRRRRLARRLRELRRRAGSRPAVVALAVALYLAAAVLATWPAIRHVDGHYLARPAAGHGEAAAGDHLQLGWSFWLVGHQLEQGDMPWSDPYSFQPESEAPPNLQGWLLGLPFWPLDRLVGHIWAYNTLLLLTFVAAGALTAWWLLALGLPLAPALAGGLVYTLAPYRVGQSTGHLLGLAAFLLPAMLLLLERRRVLAAAAVLIAIPLSGQLHLALGAVPLFAGYAWARLPARYWARAAAGALAATTAAVLVQRNVIAGSLAEGGRSLAQVDRYSAELADFVTRSADGGVERLVFLGWLTPLAALAGLVFLWRRRRGLAVLLGLATAIPIALALGTSLPLYEELWEAAEPLRFARVPARLMPIACLAVAALVAVALTRVRRQAIVVALLVVFAADAYVPVFGAVRPDAASPAYAALDEPGRLLELPVIRPDIHYGSVYLGYARQSPRERPQGYSTTAPKRAGRWAEENRALSCGQGRFPADIRFVAVHRGVYRQSGFFGAGCPAATERALEAQGFRLLARDGPISTYARTFRR
jgi:hypothetical protein